MDARLQKHRITGWMGKLFVVLSLAASYGAQAGVLDTVTPATIKWCAFRYGSNFDELCVYDSDLAAAQATAIIFNFAVLNCDGNGQCNIVHYWNGKSDTMRVSFRGTCPAPTVYPTIPYVFYPSNKMCARLVPDITNLTITLSDGNEIEPSKGTEINTLPFIAIVIDQNTNRPPTTPVTVKVSLKVDPKSGGHDHGDSNRPRGSIEDTKCASDNECWTNPTVNGEVAFNFSAPEASGIHTVTATCDGCSNTASKAVDVKVEGLWPVFDSTYYAFIGSTTEHGSNHYVTSEAQMQLWLLAQAFYEYQLQNGITNPTLLHLNDASLKWGGIFDIDADWVPDHFEHRRGSVIDIRANSSPGAIPRGLTKNFKNIAKDFGIDPHLEYDSDPILRHFHTRLLNRKE